MKVTHFIMATIVAAATAACSSSIGESQKIIDKPSFKAENRQFSIDALEALGRVADPQVSPDGTTVVYSLSYESVEENRSNAELYAVPVNGGVPTRLTKSAKSESNVQWIEGGRRIAFLCSESGAPQVWVMDSDGTNRTQLTDIEQGVEGFKVSPDDSTIVIIATVKYNRTAQDVYPDLPKANARIIDDLMYKHWDQWVTEIPHPFIARLDLSQNKVDTVKDIMQDEPYEAPMRPFGGIESIAWSPDSKQLIYVSRKKTGKEYAVSTNSDLYLYDIASGTTRNLTEGMLGYDTNPAFSPDGKYVAWLSMEHDGYESDKNRIFIMELATGEKKDLTENWDYTADAIAWDTDSKAIYFLAPKDGVTPVFRIGFDGAVETIAEGICDFASIQPLGDNKLIAMAHSMLWPNEIFKIEKDGEIKKITDTNSEIFDQLDMPTVEKRLVPTTDGKEMTTWVVYPPNFDENKKYPAILYCQGGPQQAVSQFWSYRWNLALMAAQGYIVIAPNRRGLPGFGTDWNAQISGDYGGQNMRDYLSAVDYMKQEKYVDGEHIGAVGASYGGFSVYWLAGNHDGRFACLIAHAGIFNMEAQYLETEEMWFANWDMGGPFWDYSNTTAQKTFATSPHKFVDKWTAPILVTHGEYDFRILSSQGEMAFNAAVLRGIPAEMVIFPDENHWILKPQNAILWQRVFFRWLDRWLKPQAQQPATE